MNHDSQNAYTLLGEAQTCLFLGHTGDAIELAKQAITAMEKSLPPPVPLPVYHGVIVRE